MESQMHRRPVAAKYGKNKGRTMAYNFFAEVTSQSVPKAPSPTKQFPISPQSSSSEERGNRDAIPIEPPSPSPSPASRPIRTMAHSRSSFSPGPEIRPASPMKSSAKSTAKEEPAAFEIISSDEDKDTNDGRPSKKRRLGQTTKQTKRVQVEVETNGTRSVADSKEAGKNPKKKVPRARGTSTDDNQRSNTQPKPVESAHLPELAVPKTKRQILAKKQENGMQKPKSDNQGQSKPEVPRIRRPGPNKPPSAVSRDVFDLPEVVPIKTKSKTKLKRTSQNTNPSDMKEDKLWDHEEPSDYFEVQAKPVRRARALVKTKAESPQTPRNNQRRTTDDDEVSVASVGTPGSIGLTELRLSPGHSPMPLASRSPSISGDFAQSPRPCGRMRRIDTLDAPKDTSGNAVSCDPSASQESSTLTRRLHQVIGLEQAQSAITVPALSRSNSSQRLGYGRARATYGKERSHLADMVSDLDALSQTDSQEVSQRLASQLAATSASSQLQMDLDIQDSSSDDAGKGFKLKSIHELRQAGTNDRFERDLEALLGDINPTSRTASKSLRLTACMKLFSRLSEEKFASFVSDRGLDRLTEWSRSLHDNTSKLLVVMIFWRLVHTKNASAVKARTIVQAVASSSTLITNLGSMTQMIKTRKENLSKHTIQELQDFEQTLIKDFLLPAQEGNQIVPAAVTLGALNDSLRRLVEVGTTNISIGTESYRKIIFFMLPSASQSLGAEALRNKFVIKLALSLLQLFATHLDNDLGLTAEEYVKLGDILADITKKAMDGSEDVIQSVLHFTISLCNERPHICQYLNSSKFSDAAMTIVDSRFLDLVKSVETGSTVDPAVLDSMLLTLACLLQFTEHDLKARESFAHGWLPDSLDNYLTKLTSIYTEAAPRLADAKTAEQAQVLVAFGYLSLLICNLCLSDDLWTEASASLGDNTMSDVVASAKEMLIHLQGIEQGQTQDHDMSELDGDGASALDGFTQRFSAILAAVRVS
ncbi:hypothetical protein LTR05_006789 [Lithohypha guttulata]|uniref:Wings apart-like protein C-terminal domain-containing protein n=1 Tax=Lithohypha guttulata TaxID=1690604 RepID=A0AAN7SWZ2_9EURO|nr:hypothetical protein LTR05_006789 [Lithohypha guttulata]